MPWSGAFSHQQAVDITAISRNMERELDKLYSNYRTADDTTPELPPRPTAWLTSRAMKHQLDPAEWRQARTLDRR